MKILHVITSLGQGGAEAVLYRLIREAGNDVIHVVISFREDDYYSDKLRELGIKVVSLNCKAGEFGFKSFRQLRSHILNINPDLVQTWMYHADLIGGLAVFFSRKIPVIWGIRNSNLDEKNGNRATIFIARICAYLSKVIPTKIICCAESATLYHKSIGYDSSKFIVIPNGYDETTLIINDASREKFRSKYELSEKSLVFGMIARWDPQKDHQNLIDALAHIKSHGVDFRCFLAGLGITAENHKLTEMITKQQLNDQIILLGPRSDVVELMNGFDLHILSSKSEGFPNVVAEAMCCGTPCVVTDVGDAKTILGNTGWIVMPGNALALSESILDATNVIQTISRKDLQKINRDQIIENYSLKKMKTRFHDTWRESITSKMKH